MRNKYIEEKRKADARVDWLIKNKVQWINPTISPAPKNTEKREIESVQKALEYYQPYADKVVLQTKYMGSYCGLYLNKDHSKSYFVSRNGYVIKHVEGLHKASEWLHTLLLSENLEWVIVEAELMPWRTLGKGLIDDEYGNYGYLHQSHLEILKNSSAVSKIETLKQDLPWNREDLKQHETRQYGVLKELSIPELGEYETSISLYQQQLAIFGYEGEVEFKPFNILKTIDVDGNEQFPEQNGYFTGIVIDSDDYETAYEFFNSHVAANEEGIVVKPLKQQLINVAPCFKVRTNSYLQLIYGVNFDRDFDYYLEKRNIGHKLSRSIEDYEIAIQMLRTPYTNVEKAKSLYYQAIDAEIVTKNLDTRL